MADTFTSRLRIRTPGDGDYEDAGAVIFKEIMQITDDAIAGVATIAMSDGNYALSANNGSSDESRNAVLVVTGALTSTRSLIVPSTPKLYVVYNNTSGGQQILVRTASGAGVPIPAGYSSLVRCDGSSVAPQVTCLPSGVIVEGGGALVTASATQTLANKTLADPVVSGQMQAATGAQATPSYAFNGDANTGIYSPGADTLGFTTGGTDKGRIDSVGRLALGTSTPAAAVHVRQGSNATQSVLLQDSATTRAGQITGGSNGSGGYVSAEVGNVGGTFLEVWRGTPNQVMHVGTSTSTDTWHILKNPNATGQGDRILSVDCTSALSALQLFYVINNSWSSANCAMRVGAHNATGRSINAAGSVNSTGADYAEWHLAAAECGPFSPGDVIGLDEHDEVTDRFDDALTFGVVSTNPAMVGGDGLSDDPRGVMVAYCGRVPVNGLAADTVQAGMYLEATRDGDGKIAAAANRDKNYRTFGRIAKVNGGQITARVFLGA